MSETAAARTVGAGTLYLRCVAWGLATGASTGAVFGLITIWGVGAGRRDTVMPSLIDALTGTAFGVLLGTVIGSVVSVIPSVVGGLFVTGLIGHLHPQPSSTTGVQRDLRRIFVVFVAALNTALLLAIFTRGNGLSSVTSIIPYIVAGDVSVALML